MLNALIVISIIVSFVWFEILLVPCALFAPRRLLAWSETLQRRDVRLIFAILRSWRGFSPRLEDRTGLPLPGRFVLVANHQSLLDIPVVWRLLPERHRIRFVAKRELGFGIPFVSTCLRLQGHGLITRRGDLRGAMRGMARFARRCARDASCPVIFPEGTRSRDGSLGSFHTAGFRRIMETESLPVLVAAIEGGSRVATIRDIMGNLGTGSYRVRLVALLPAPAGKAEVAACLEESRRLIGEALEEMRREG